VDQGSAHGAVLTGQCSLQDTKPCTTAAGSGMSVSPGQQRQVWGVGPDQDDPHCGGEQLMVVPRQLTATFILLDFCRGA